MTATPVRMVLRVWMNWTDTHVPVNQVTRAPIVKQVIYTNMYIQYIIKFVYCDTVCEKEMLVYAFFNILSLSLYAEVDFWSHNRISIALTAMLSNYDPPALWGKTRDGIVVKFSHMENSEWKLFNYLFLKLILSCWNLCESFLRLCRCRFQSWLQAVRRNLKKFLHRI